MSCFRLSLASEEGTPRSVNHEHEIPAKHSSDYAIELRLVEPGKATRGRKTISDSRLGGDSDRRLLRDG